MAAAGGCRLPQDRGARWAPALSRPATTASPRRRAGGAVGIGGALARGALCALLRVRVVDAPFNRRARGGLKAAVGLRVRREPRRLSRVPGFTYASWSWRDGAAFGQRQCLGLWLAVPSRARSSAGWVGLWGGGGTGKSKQGGLLRECVLRPPLLQESAVNRVETLLFLTRSACLAPLGVLPCFLWAARGSLSLAFFMFCG